MTLARGLTTLTGTERVSLHDAITAQPGAATTGRVATEARGGEATAEPVNENETVGSGI
jgi:hypothetical protein